MIDHFQGVRLKMARARQHLEELQREFEAFIEQDPYPVVQEMEPDGGKRVFRVKNPKRAPVARWGLIVGDIVHNLRSALDHLAWQLAQVHSGIAPDGTEFPIFLEEAAYKRTDRKSTPARGSGLYKVRGMDDGAQTLIESLQPYNRGRTMDPLWVLHSLDIIDKHRIIPVITVTHDKIETNWSIPPGTEVRAPRFEIFPYALEHDAVSFVLHIAPPNPAVHVDAKPTYTVVLGERMIDEPRFVIRENLDFMIDNVVGYILSLFGADGRPSHLPPPP